MKLPFCVMLFLSYLYPTNCFNVAKFHAQISTTLKKQRCWFNVHSLKNFKTLLGSFHVNSQEVVRAPTPIFLKFYSNCHYLMWWTSAKFERNLSRNDMIIKLFEFGGSSGGDTNYSYLAMFEALLLPNYISEQPQYFRDASSFAKYWKNNIISIVNFKDQRSWPPKFDCFYFLLQTLENFQTSSRFYFLIVLAHIRRIVADKIIVDLRKFYCKILKDLWDILGQTWHEMKKLEKWDTFVALVPQSGVNLLISQTFWYFAIKFS